MDPDSARGGPPRNRGLRPRKAIRPHRYFQRLYSPRQRRRTLGHPRPYPPRFQRAQLRRISRLGRIARLCRFVVRSAARRYDDERHAIVVQSPQGRTLAQLASRRDVVGQRPSVFCPGERPRRRARSLFRRSRESALGRDSRQQRQGRPRAQRGQHVFSPDRRRVPRIDTRQPQPLAHAL